MGRCLTAKLKHQHVKTRSTQGGAISYVEGWHVIAALLVRERHHFVLTLSCTSGAASAAPSISFAVLERGEQALPVELGWLGPPVGGRDPLLCQDLQGRGAFRSEAVKSGSRTVLISASAMAERASARFLSARSLRRSRRDFISVRRVDRPADSASSSSADRTSSAKISRSSVIPSMCLRGSHRRSAGTVSRMRPLKRLYLVTSTWTKCRRVKFWTIIDTLRGDMDTINIPLGTCQAPASSEA